MKMVSKYKIKELFNELKSVWKLSKKPTWEETRQMVIVTIIISLLVGMLGFIIFVLINYLIYNI